MEIKLAVAQMEILPGELELNCRKIESFARRAHRHHCQFLCLPEYCWVGPDHQERLENETSRFVQVKAAYIAKRYHLYLIAGSVLESHHHDGRMQHTHNFCYIFSPEGKRIGRYAKRHPVPSLEGNLEPGRIHRVFDTVYGKIGIQICRDIIYPETTHVIANMGAKIIFSPAFWSKFSTEFSSSIKDFHANDALQMIKYCVPARALENSAIFVFCNPAGTYTVEDRRDVMLGYSQICQPYSGVVKIVKNNKEKLLMQIINTDVVDEARAGWRIRGH